MKISILSLFLALFGFGQQRLAASQDVHYQTMEQKVQEEQGQENQRQQMVTEQHIKEKNPGFFQHTSDKPQVTIAGAIVDTASTSYYESILVLKVSCEAMGSIVKLPPRFKNISWKLEKDEKADKGIKYTSEGQSQTDGDGFLRIRFSTQGSISDKKIFLKLGAIENSFVLYQGPHEITVPESFCKNKH